jgi:hypothetical protein
MKMISNKRNDLESLSRIEKRIYQAELMKYYDKY